MNLKISEIKNACLVAGLFVLLLLIIFITELAVMNLFSTVFTLLDPVTAGLLDATVLVVLFSMPLWFFVIRPLYLENISGNSLRKRACVIMFLKSLAVIFLAEFAVMLLLPEMLPDVDNFTLALLDSALIIVVAGPPLYWLVFRPVLSERTVSLKILFSVPLRLYLLLLSLVFFVDLLDDSLISIFFAGSEFYSHRVTDSFVFTMIAAPFLWALMMRPLEIDALREKSRSTALQAQVIDAIMTIDEKGVIESFNPAAEKIFGYPAKEMIGQCATVLLCSNQGCLDEVVNEAGACENGMVAHLPHEVSGRRRDGTVLTMDVSVSKIRMGGRITSLVIMRDVSDRKQAEAERQRSLSLLSATLESTADGILVIDTERRVQTFNQKFLDMWGFSRQIVEGSNGYELFPRVQDQLQDARAFLARMEELCRKPGSTVQDTIRFTDGRVFEVFSQPQMLDGQSVGRVWSFRDITAKTKVEDALRASEERFNIAINGASDGIWDWDITTGAVYYSPRFREMLGFSEQEMGNVVESFENLLHPEDHDRVMNAVRAHLDKKIPYGAEYRLLTSSGTYLWFRARGQAVWDETGKAVRMAGSISDINRSKEAEAAVREGLMRFRQIFEQAEHAIFFFKPGTCSVIDVNHSAEELYGFTKSELKAEGLELLCRPEDFGMLRKFVSGIRGGEMSCLENIVNRRKDGTEIMVTVCGKVMTLQGVDIVYCSFRDVTERFRMEEKAREIQARLIQANKMTSLGLLVSGVAHEINNPNNFILANAQLLAGTWHDALKVLREYYEENGDFLVGGIPFSQMDEQSEQLFAGIIDGSRRINEIVGNLKGFARQERTATGCEVDVNQVATSAVSIMRHELAKYTENFHLDLTDNIPPVKGSGQQLGQVIINLLMNACQALPARDHGIWLETGYDATDEKVTISVRDEGCGMTRDVGIRIMEPFFTTKLDAGGTGLGLSISQAIIKDHEGIMEFSSEPGKGTTFVVKMPAANIDVKERLN